MALTSASADSTVTTTLEPVADSYAVSSSPSSSFGTEPSIRVSAAVFRGLLKFDTSAVSPQSTIASVELRLYATRAPANGGIDAHALGNGWTESTSWAEQPVWNPSVVATSTTPVAGSWMTISLPASTVTKGGNSSWGLSYSVRRVVTDLASRADPAHAPQLVITYWSTTAGSPLVTTGPASRVGSSDATLTATVDAQTTASTCSFAYGTSTSYSARTPAQTVNTVAGQVDFTANISSLTAGTAYNYRAECTNQTGSTYGSNETFRTVSHVSGHNVTKVLTIVEENHGFSQGMSQMPYLANLGKQYGYATDYHAITHPSLPNYLALAGGSTLGVTTNCGVSTCPQSSSTVFDQAIAVGRTAKVYAEDMTSNCQEAGSGDGLYAVRHTAWPYFTSATSRANCNQFQVPAGTYRAGSFKDDVTAGRLPNISWLIPNLCNDAHNSGCSLAGADRWLQDYLPLVFASSDWKSGHLAVVVTADEDEGNSGNAVLTVVMHPDLNGKVAATSLDHYSMTKFQEQVVGVPDLLKAATATDLGPAFGLTIGP